MKLGFLPRSESSFFLIVCLILLIEPVLLGSVLGGSNSVAKTWGGAVGNNIPLALHFSENPVQRPINCGSLGLLMIDAGPSRTTKTHQLANVAPRWNLTFKMFQLPSRTLADPALYDN